jgi:CRISPR-associated protein Csd2
MKMSLQNKIDFALILSVKNANPNGDPLNGNRPRTNYMGIGEISDVCLKRKIRNRLLDNKEKIFVQSDDYRFDGCTTLIERVKSIEELRLLMEKLGTKKKKSNKKNKNDGNNDSNESENKTESALKEEFKSIAKKTWFDVRCFGQVFPFSASDNKEKDSEDSDNSSQSGISIAIRGPVTIQSAYSLEPVDITTLQITKSVSLKPDSDSDTMGTKHYVNKGVYVTYGSINCQLAELTGFSKEDAEKLKEAMISIFENDASAARPDGSMEVCNLIWWQHNCKSGQYSAAKVHRSLRDIINADGSFDESVLKTALPDLVPEIIAGK